MTDLSELDRLLEDQDMAEATLAGAVTERKCRRHVWMTPALVGEGTDVSTQHMETRCYRCNILRDEARSRRGRNSRSYGNRAELKVARVYGGEKIGHVGGPVDVRGKDWNVQVKTHRRLPPTEWRKAFQAMSEKRERLPKLLLRFLPGPGLPPDDYFVIRGSDWLAWYGKDDDDAA